MSLVAARLLAAVGVSWADAWFVARRATQFLTAEIAEHAEVLSVLLGVLGG